MHLMKLSVGLPVIASLLLVGVDAHAAKSKCKFETDSTDKFTKVRTLQTRWDSLEGFFSGIDVKGEDLSPYVAAWHESGETFLLVRVNITYWSKRQVPDYDLRDTIVIPEGARLLVMMEDESVVTLNAISEVRTNATAMPPKSPGNDVDEWYIESNAVIPYPLDDDLIKALTSQNATNLRVEGEDRNHDVKIHRKSLGDLKKAIECIQGAL